jgi:hypothetical protein
VCADVDALLDDDGKRSIVKQTYFERLLRADIGDRLRVAADRRDPATAEFCDAVGRFFEAVPPAIMASTDVHLAQVIRSAAYRFSALAPSARSSYWRVIRSWHATPIDHTSVATRRSGRLWLARVRPPVSEAAASAVLYLTSPRPSHPADRPRLTGSARALDRPRRASRARIPVVPLVCQKRLARIASAAGGAATILIAARSSAARSGRDDPGPVASTMGAMPGRSDATTGTPAAMASNSFCGVVERWLVVVGWMAITGRRPTPAR